MTSRKTIWLVGVSFVLFQFFMQLSSGVVIGAILQEMDFSAFVAGLLGSSWYVIYTLLQIPVGILFDQKNTKYLLAFNALICSLGCFLFASSHSLTGLFLGRILMGGGSAFAFVGLSHLLRQHYPLRHFAFMIGLSETLAFVVTCMVMMGMGPLLLHWGWRNFIYMAGIVCVGIAYLCWKKIPNRSDTTEHVDYHQQILAILSNKYAWINGLFVGLTFTIVTVFGALWAVPFLQLKLSCSLQQASFLTALFFLGAGISCPLFGFLSNQFQHRKPLILSSCVSTLVLIIYILYGPIQQSAWMGLLLFTMGICCGAYMLAYTIANELSPKGSLSTCTGFTNTLAILSAPILQPITGYLVDFFSQHHEPTLSAYQKALATVPISLVLASVLVLFLPAKSLENADVCEYQGA
jgi:MFS family permease